jgi:hypothetical protein
MLRNKAKTKNSCRRRRSQGDSGSRPFGGAERTQGERLRLPRKVRQLYIVEQRNSNVGPGVGLAARNLGVRLDEEIAEVRPRCAASRQRFMQHMPRATMCGFSAILE